MARIIDADALETIYKGWIEQLRRPEDEKERTAIETALTVLREEPTIDPVKHGKWEFGRQRGAAGYWCTNCQSGFTGENAEWIAKEHDFCPKCGARMDGE